MYKRMIQAAKYMPAIGIVLILLMSCGQSKEETSVPEGYIEYSGSSFSLQVPAAWKQASSSEFIAVFAAQMEQDFSANMGISTSNISSGTTLADIADTARRVQSQDYPNYSIVEEGPMTLAGGTAAYKRIYTWHDDDFNLDIKQMQVFVKTELLIYTITATSLESLYDKYGSAFEYMVNTFQVDS